MVMKNDKEAIQVCLKSCTNINRNNPRIVRIPNTLELERIWLSEAYWQEIQKRDNIRIETKVEDLEFTNEGNLI